MKDLHFSFIAVFKAYMTCLFTIIYSQNWTEEAELKKRITAKKYRSKEKSQ